MKVLVKILGLIIALVFLMAACGGKTETAVPPTPKGPALIMFYTDN